MESVIFFQEPTADQEPINNLTATCRCGSTSNKKRSPSSPIQPNPKREKPFSLLHPSSRGFTKLPLPEFPPLRRCTSDPVPLLPENTLAAAAQDTPSPVRAGSSASRGLCRSVSAPERDLVAASGSIGESPNSKRLKRMKDRMREMSKWCDEVIAEGDEDNDEEGEDHLVCAEVVNNEAPKDDEIESSENEEAEAVSVEKKGECLVIHMKCPCSKAYQFLLTQNNSNCYYKLM